MINRMSSEAIIAIVEAHLEEINTHLLDGAGRILSVPGKVSLVWDDPVTQTPRFLSAKAAGEDALLINGRRFPSTIEGVRQGLRASLPRELRERNRDAKLQPGSDGTPARD